MSHAFIEQDLSAIISMRNKMQEALDNLKWIIDDASLKEPRDAERESREAEGESREAERESVFRYMFDLQKSGVTNMLGSDRYVQRHFGFPLEKAEQYLNEYLENYNGLYLKYGTPRNSEIPQSNQQPSNGSPVTNTTPKKTTGIVAWNAYKNAIRIQMATEFTDRKLKYEEVQRRAVESKAADPAAYKAFCESLSSTT